MTSWADYEDEEDTVAPIIETKKIEAVVLLPDIWFIFADDWDFARSKMTYVTSTRYKSDITDLIKTHKLRWWHAYHPATQMILYDGDKTIKASGDYKSRFTLPNRVKKQYPEFRSPRKQYVNVPKPKVTTTKMSVNNAFDALDDVEDFD